MCVYVYIRYRNPNHCTDLDEIWHGDTPHCGKGSWLGCKPYTTTPGVRGALNRVWPASAASTVRLGKNFIKQKL